MGPPRQVPGAADPAPWGMGDVRGSLKEAQEAGLAYLVKIDAAVVGGKKAVEGDVSKTAQAKRELVNAEKVAETAKTKLQAQEALALKNVTALKEAEELARSVRAGLPQVRPLSHVSRNPTRYLTIWCAQTDVVRL